MPGFVEVEDRSASLVPTVDMAPFMADPETPEAQEVVRSRPVRRAATKTFRSIAGILWYQISGEGEA